MNVTLLYFAGVKDLIGRADEPLTLPAGVSTVARLRDHLIGRYPALEGRVGSIRFAINEEFVQDEATLTTGDEIALIPPVAGG